MNIEPFRLKVYKFKRQLVTKLGLLLNISISGKYRSEVNLRISVDILFLYQIKVCHHNLNDYTLNIFCAYFDVKIRKTINPLANKSD